MKKLLTAGLALATMMLAACGDDRQPAPANSANVSAPPYHDTQTQ